MRPALELADIVRHHGAAYRATHADRLGRSQRRVLSAIEACRTAPLGGHVERCTDCGVIRVAYNSCRNRHCPKCQGLARAQWLADRHAELLPVPYFHVVFTLPGPIAAIAFHNKAVVYDLLFKTAIDTLRTIATDPKHLGAEIGVISVLHTWGQTLGHHPHAHCIVPGGGLAPDDTGWIACRPGFFLPVRVLARLYRRRFLERLEAAFDAGALSFGGDLAGLSDPAAFAARLRPWRRVDWVVYAKRPFGGPEQVLAYLGRYTHRVAIANCRLIGLTEGRVSFRWKDYPPRQLASMDVVEIRGARRRAERPSTSLARERRRVAGRGGHRFHRLGWSCRASPQTDGGSDDRGEDGTGRAAGEGRRRRLPAHGRRGGAAGADGGRCGERDRRRPA